MKNIIVTGGLGFIGSNLVHKLSKKYKIILIDKKTYSANTNNLKGIDKKKIILIKKDINNTNLIFKILLKYKPLAIFNLAAETHVDRSIDSAKPFIYSNIVGTFSILEALKRYYKINKKIKLIHVSTDEVYGDITKNKFSKETDPYVPSSPYAASKASSDHLVRAYFRTYKLPVIITNCSNNYGPRQFPEKLIPKLILNILKNKNLPIYGNGKNEREWIYVEDHINALILIFKKGQIGQSYNIGSGIILNNIQICKIIISIITKKLNINTKSKILYIKDRPGHDMRYALDSNKIKKKLKWKNKTNITNGLEKTINWYVNNQSWIRNLEKK